MKKIIITSCVLLYSVYAFSQASEIEWQNSIGGSAADDFYGVEQTGDGGFILACQSSSGIGYDKTEINSGEADYWVIKTDASGNIEWQNTIGGSGSDLLKCARQTADGGYILGGTSFSGISGDKTEENMSGAGMFPWGDYWIIKLDSAGNIEWQNTIGGSAMEEFFALDLTSDGGYIIGGESESNTSGDKSEDNYCDAFMPNGWIVKLNSAGEVEWDKTIGGSFAEELRAIQQTFDGGYILGLDSYSGISGNKTLANFGAGDYWIVKLDASGNILWQEAYGGTGADNFQSLQQTADHGFIVAGFSNSGISGNKTEACRGLEDFWVVKTNSAGEIQWDKTAGGSGTDRLWKISASGDGGFLLSGSSMSGISGDKTEPNLGFGNDDFWVVKLDHEGGIQWQNTLGGTEVEMARTASVTADGGYILGGFSYSGISGDKTEENMGGSDCWLVKLNTDPFIAPDSLFADEITATGAKLHWTYPPAAHKFQIFYRVYGTMAWTKKASLVNYKNITGLLPETTYEFKVRTKYSDVPTAFSGIALFTTLPLRNAEQNIRLSVTVFPIPAADILTISLSIAESECAAYSISDMQGKKVASSQLSARQTNINISDLAAGIYFITILSDKDSRTVRFIKN